jgi:hypothetical protein
MEQASGASTRQRSRRGASAATTSGSDAPALHLLRATWRPLHWRRWPRQLLRWRPPLERHRAGGQAQQLPRRDAGRPFAQLGTGVRLLKGDHPVVIRQGVCARRKLLVTSAAVFAGLPQGLHCAANPGQDEGLLL